MSLHSRQPRSMPGGSGSQRSQSAHPSALPRPRSRMPGRLVVAGLSAVLLVAIGDRLLPAIRAGLHDGTRGFWVATSESCARSACTWNGKFVSGGHVVLSSARYYGRLPAGLHAGSSVRGLFTGASGIVFPANGSDLWIWLLVALVAAGLGLYWSSRPLVKNYVRQRSSAANSSAANSSAANSGAANSGAANSGAANSGAPN